MPPKFHVLPKARIQEYVVQEVRTTRGFVERNRVVRQPRKTRSLSPTRSPTLQPKIELAQPSMVDIGTSYNFDPGDSQFEEMDGTFNRRSGKTQHDYMKQWLQECRALYYSRILQLKAGPGDPKCTNCHVGKSVWRCIDCIGVATVCTLCCRQMHHQMPFHRIEKWNGRFYQKGALWQVGVKIYGGHSGAQCPTTLTHGSESSLNHPNFLNDLARSFNKSPSEVLDHLCDTVEGVETGTVGQDLLSHLFSVLGQSGTNVLLHLRHSMVEAERDAELITVMEAAQVRDQEKTNQYPDPDDITVMTRDLPIEQEVEEDPLEEEMEEGKGRGAGTPGIIPAVPDTDASGNSFLTIVDRSGIHYLPMVWCACDGADDRDLQLLDLRLYPTSRKIIKTVFTFTALDDHRVDNLECKTSSYQYHEKLRRLTSAAFPHFVPNRYAELRRVSRQWRNLKLRKYFGIGSSNVLERGSLALFCAACPQPDINLPLDWEQSYSENPNLYLRFLAGDGNFKADHMRHANNAADVPLTAGEGFMTEPNKYHAHLKVAKESKQKPDCNRYRAQNNAETAHNGCDITGLGAHCCGRHGCFAPGSAVDFQLGEAQRNMDWSLCESCATVNLGKLRRVFHCYDINCQYHKHLADRISQNPLLHMDDDIEIVQAIGLFHVHGHRDECLYRYATSYIPGAGIIDGEILETLWAVLNSVSRSTRTATLAHRSELLDDHMGDSNFKKMVNIVTTIITKYRRAKENKKLSGDYFKEIDDAAPRIDRDNWIRQITEAEENRQHDITSMDCMKATVDRGISLKETELLLAQQSARGAQHAGDDGSLMKWLRSGLVAESTQIEIRQHVRRLGKHPTTDQLLDLARKRQRLAATIRKFHSEGAKYLDDRVIAQLSRESNLGNTTADDFEEEGVVNAPAPVANDIENSRLVFPLTSGCDVAENVKAIQLVEVEMRKGKANDALQDVRETLGYLSFQFLTKVRRAKTTGQNLRSWRDVKLLVGTLNHHRMVYNVSQRFLIKFDANLAKIYPPLLSSQCKVSQVMNSPNAPGQSQLKLPWFWGAVNGYDPEFARTHAGDNERILEFYRVHWLRARAQGLRWTEELERTEHEMEWVTRYFMFKAREWLCKRDEARTEKNWGGVAYAEQIINMWDEFGRMADLRFGKEHQPFQHFWLPAF